MEQVTLQRLTRAKTGAPALSRGLAILATLSPDAPASLEQLSNRLSIPKSTTLRLLETLIQIGLVEKTADKCYRPLWQLNPVGDSRELFRRNLESKLPALCDATDCTIEWYEASAEGMRLILQQLPESELRVQATPGFLRDWSTEFEAVARLGHAFANEAPPIDRTQRYVSDGKMETLSAHEIREWTERARHDRSAYDPAFNRNGVRRFAAAALDDQERLIGVLALAEGYHFSERPNAETYLKQLKETLNQ